LALLGSASKKLKAFTEVFGKFASKEVLENGNIAVTTTTGVRLLLAKDVTGVAVNTPTKVFNADVKNHKPGTKAAIPTVMTAPEFEILVNLTDGGIITASQLMEKAGLLLEKLVMCVRNGEMRGWAHQFRMNYQVKGLNVVSDAVKEMTGFDMIIFDGAMKTNLLELLEAGKELEYHVMLTASVFSEDKVSRISAQAMNNLNIDPAVTTGIAKEMFAKAEKALNDMDAFNETYGMVRQGKEYQEMKHALSVPFGMDKFYTINPIVRKDIKAQIEVQEEINDMIRQHKNGYLFVQGKNNYMFTDLFAILTAVADGTFVAKKENMAAGIGEVVLPMADKKGRRFFYTGDIISIRSPHVNSMETQTAKAVDPTKSENKALAAFWQKQLEGGFLDGITFFSACDIMVPASSGADFDGDTSLIIIDVRITSVIKPTAQYINFHVVEGGAYEYNSKGELVAGYVFADSGKVVPASKLQELLQNKVAIVKSNNSEILGSGCPDTYSETPQTPAFTLEAGMFQDGYKIYIPANMIDTDEAYKAWLDSIHQVIRYNIQSSDIGRMSNIVMAIVNGINYVESMIATNKAEMAKLLASEAYTVMNQLQQHHARAKFDNSLLEMELGFMNQMLEVFTFITWVAIDAAKHGGAYKKHLAAWMKWTTKKEMERIMDEIEDGTEAYAKSMKRVIGYEGTKRDVMTYEAKSSKVAIILPNALRQAKHKFVTVKGKTPTNLQLFCEEMAVIFKEAEDKKKNIKVKDHNLLGTMYSVLADTSFNTVAAKKLYAKVADQFVERDDKLRTAMRALKNRTEAIFVEGRNIDFSSMNNSKQNARVKKLFPEYGALSAKRSELLIRTRQILHSSLIKLDVDIVKFTAAAYVYAYEKALELEKKNNKKTTGHVHALWQLLDTQLIHMFAALEGARVKGVAATRIFDLKNLYVNQPVNGLSVVAEQMKAKNMKIDLAIAASKDGGFDVFMVKRGKDVSENQLIGKVVNDAAGLLINDLVYRVKGAMVLNVSTNGNVSFNFEQGEVHIKVNSFEGLQPMSARKFAAQMKDATRLDVTLYDGATLEDLKEGKFVAMKVQGTIFIAKKTEVGMKTVAVSQTPCELVEGKNHSIKVEFSSLEGNLKAYVFEAVMI
jgi:hypothetical protein